MPKCMLLTPFPLVKPRHGGQARAASIMSAMRLAGWDVDSVAIFPEFLFPPQEWGPLDIVMASSAMHATISSDFVFADFHAARLAAKDQHVVAALRSLTRRLNPDVIHIEHPWPWLVLREALPSSPRIRLIYSSQNIEWRAREGLFRIGMRNKASDEMLAASRLLEEEFARVADLVLSISDIEADEIQRMSGREVIYLPPISDLTLSRRSGCPSRFAGERRASSCRYAALMASSYWPNIEGFFDLFPAGLGFLAHREQIWVAGALGSALQKDRRFKDFLSIN
jgi:Glycosyl transferase 4-like domain